MLAPLIIIGIQLFPKLFEAKIPEQIKQDALVTRSLALKSLMMISLPLVNATTR